MQQRGPSSEEELALLYPNYTDDDFTWEAFGNCSTDIIDRLVMKWFPEKPAKQGLVHDIWARHPIRQQQGKVMYLIYKIVIVVLSTTHLMSHASHISIALSALKSLYISHLIFSFSSAAYLSHPISPSRLLVL
jgi:hypothetical protein